MSEPQDPTIASIAGESTDYIDLWEAFRQQADEAHPEFGILAGVCSMLLNPDGGDGERFSPMWVLGDGSTSFTPAHLSDGDIALLRTLELANVALRARVSDLLWELVSGRDRIKYVHAAIDAYIELAQDGEPSDRDELLRRTISLAVRFRASDGGARKDRIRTLILDSMPVDGTVPVEVLFAVEQLRDVGAELEDQGRVVALLRDAQAVASGVDFGLARSLIAERQRWTEDEPDRHALSIEIADQWVAEADSRLEGAHRSSFVAASFIESAVQVLRTIPRKVRDTLHVDDTITLLRARMADLSAAAVDEMIAIDSPEFTVRGIAKQARDHVAGLPSEQALFRFTHLFRWLSELDERSAAEAALAGRLHLPATSLTKDGRVADRAGVDDVVDSEMGRSAQHHRTIMTLGVLVPALQALRADHIFTRRDFLQLAHASAFVPPGHENLFAAGLSAGWNFDFGVAIHILTPRLEAAVRYHLKHVGVITTHLAQDGVETEVSLPALLEKPEAAAVFGEDPVYELRSLFAGRFGANLRHEIAHGLTDDSIATSLTAVYAWWIIFRLFMSPFWNRAAATATSGGDDGEDEASSPDD